MMKLREGILYVTHKNESFTKRSCDSLLRQVKSHDPLVHTVKFDDVEFKSLSNVSYLLFHMIRTETLISLEFGPTAKMNVNIFVSLCESIAANGKDHAQLRTFVFQSNRLLNADNNNKAKWVAKVTQAVLHMLQRNSTLTTLILELSCVKECDSIISAVTGHPSLEVCNLATPPPPRLLEPAIEQEAKRAKVDE